MTRTGPRIEASWLLVSALIAAGLTFGSACHEDNNSGQSQGPGTGSNQGALTGGGSPPPPPPPTHGQPPPPLPSEPPPTASNNPPPSGYQTPPPSNSGAPTPTPQQNNTRDNSNPHDLNAGNPDSTDLVKNQDGSISKNAGNQLKADGNVADILARAQTLPDVKLATGRFVGSTAETGGTNAPADVSQIKAQNKMLEEMLRQQIENAPQGPAEQDRKGSAGAPSFHASTADGDAQRLQFSGLMRGARDKLRVGDWRGALSDLNAILAQDPKNVQALTKRAEALNHLKLFAQAEADARKAIELDPKNPAAWRQLAWSLLKQKKYKEALEAINRAIELDPNNATGYAIRSYIKDAMGDHKGGMEDLAKAALLDPAYRNKLELAQQSGKIYDPNEDDDETMAGTVLNARVPMPKWFGWFVLATLALLSLGGGLSYQRRSSKSSAEKQAAMIAERPAAPAFTAQSGGKMVGKYELGRVVGRGGMGEVYEAKDLSLDRTVAIKKMTAGLSSMETQGRAMLIKEAKMVAALHHPAIVDIYEIIEQDDNLFLVFEFVKGKTANQVLVEAGGRLSVAKSLEFLRPVCQALTFAHSQNLVHRDLKPANIMITDQGHVKLMDFGVARSLSDATPAIAAAAGAQNTGPFARTQMVVGTPSYMSPETGEGIVCKEADVYSLGVTLYEMLTGRLPFEANATVMDKMAMKCAAPSAVAPDLPKAVDELIGLALQPRPEHRLKTPAEFLAKLEAIAAAAPKVAA